MVSTGEAIQTTERPSEGQARTTATTTTQTPETTLLPAYTSKPMVSTGEAIQTNERPSEGGGKKKQRGQSEGKGTKATNPLFFHLVSKTLIRSLLERFSVFSRRLQNPFTNRPYGLFDNL